MGCSSARKNTIEPTPKDPNACCIVVTGAPASGKGTQAEEIKEKLDFLYWLFLFLAISQAVIFFVKR